MAKRMFVALELPERSRQTLAALAEPLRGARWVPAAQLHLTLAFLGEVDAKLEDPLRERLATVRVPPFWLPLRGLGTFGGTAPSVIWAGVGSGHPHLFALHKHIHDALFAAGLNPDLRSFHPHVTLARLRNVPATALRPFLRHHADEDFGLIHVSGFTLFTSNPGPNGSVYHPELQRQFG